MAHGVFQPQVLGPELLLGTQPIYSRGRCANCGWCCCMSVVGRRESCGDCSRTQGPAGMCFQAEALGSSGPRRALRHKAGTTEAVSSL